MLARILSIASVVLLAPAVLTAAPVSTAAPGGVSAASFAVAPSLVAGTWHTFAADDPRCGRGRAWGCRRDRRDDWDDDRYDRRADRWERDRWERDRWERDRWERERWERERWERIRYERARYRARYGYYDRRYARYDGYAVACVRAGGRVLGAVLVVCVP